MALAFPLRYMRKRTPEQRKLYGRRCRIVEEIDARTVRVQFAGAEQVVVSRRALVDAPANTPPVMPLR